MTNAEVLILTSAQVAATLGITQRHTSYLSRQHGVGRKIGRNWFYTPADLERLRQIRAENRPGTYPRHKPRLPD